MIDGNSKSARLSLVGWSLSPHAEEEEQHTSTAHTHELVWLFSPPPLHSVAPSDAAFLVTLWYMDVLSMRLCASLFVTIYAFSVFRSIVEVKNVCCFVL